MDCDYEMLLAELGPLAAKSQPSAAQLEAFRGRLPDKLLEYWEKYGWGGYHNGLFWLTNPIDYVPVVDAWLKHTNIANPHEYFVIVRSAFGKLFLWSKKSGQNVSISPHSSLVLTSPPDTQVTGGNDNKALQYFISGVDAESLDLLDSSNRRLFDDAIKKLGPVSHGEMYGFEPALCLGGKPKIGNLVKVETIPYLILLEQLSEVDTKNIDVDL